MKFSLCTAALALATLLSGCASSPSVRYHSLSSTPALAAEAQSQSQFVVDVLPVGVPAALDQAQLVVRQPDGGVDLLNSERWAGPLPDEIRSALSEALTQRLGTQDVAGLGQQRGKPVMRVKVQIRGIEGWPGQRALLAADWSLRFTDEPQQLQFVCRGVFEAPAIGGYPELVRALQHTIDQLAAQIAGGAQAWTHSRETQCNDLVRVT